MNQIGIRASRKYNVFVETEKNDNNLKLLLDEYKIGRVLLVTDENVYRNHEQFIDQLGQRLKGSIIFKPGESTKNIESIIDIYKKSVDINLSRADCIIALGGGVIGDLSGFAASTYMRGIKFIQVPTTLMAQCDSSIGGKTGFDFMGSKNVIGTFYQPEFVYTKVDFLDTLDIEEYRSGLAEIIKYGFVCDSPLFSFLEEKKQEIKNKDFNFLLDIITDCIKIKSMYVEQDEYDMGLRQILNYGHTVGHGIEAALDFNILHGEAVAIGMRAEALIALKNEFINKEIYLRLLNLIKYFELPYSLKHYEINMDKILEHMRRDKKMISGKLKFILPDGVGSAIITSDINNGIIEEVLREMMVEI